jgi:hypothetical protein
MFDDSEYHRRRAEAEMEKALAACGTNEAMRHLELARIHRQRRDAMAMRWREFDLGSRPAIYRTDKEG